MSRKTPFHEASDKFIRSLDGSSKLFSNLVDVFSAIAWHDFSNDWAPDLAERCFKFNKGQKKFQEDFRSWVDSVSEQDVEMICRLLGIGAPGPLSHQDKGGDRYRHSKEKKAHANRYGRKTKGSVAARKEKSSIRHYPAR